VITDDREGARPGSFLWAGNEVEAGQFLHAYYSRWLPASLLADGQLAALGDALFAGSRHWRIALHFNKGLAGASDAELAAAGDTATSPAVLDAFALAVIIAEGSPAFAHMPDADADPTAARRDAVAVQRAGDEVSRVVPRPGSYVSESDFFIADWQEAFWGSNYQGLLAVKRKYDPTGLFFVHHGVGSDDWSADGFTRVAG
jgi:hypothetical protein